MTKFVIGLMLLGSFSVHSAEVCKISVGNDPDSWSKLARAFCTENIDAKDLRAKAEYSSLAEAKIIKKLLERGYTLKSDNVLVK